MKQSIRSTEAGIAHLGAVILLLLVLAGVGFAGYRVMNSSSSPTASDSTSVSESADDSDTAIEKDLATEDAADAKLSGQENPEADDANE